MFVVSFNLLNVNTNCTARTNVKTLFKRLNHDIPNGKTVPVAAMTLIHSPGSNTFVIVIVVGNVKLAIWVAYRQ